MNFMQSLKLIGAICLILLGGCVHAPTEKLYEEFLSIAHNDEDVQHREEKALADRYAGQTFYVQGILSSKDTDPDDPSLTLTSVCDRPAWSAVIHLDRKYKADAKALKTGKSVSVKCTLRGGWHIHKKAPGILALWFENGAL